ncbi:MAG: glycosyltransferase family 39 protein [Chloroflexota bacterium]|nr:glycosyltransferase family 39 protein [Chloroflexota bacterium]
MFVALVGLVAGMQRAEAMAIASASVAFDHASTDWNAGERAADGTAFRWTGEESTLTFRAARRVLPTNKPLTLTMRFAARPPGAPAATVTLLANGQTLDTWPASVEHPVAVDVAALLRRHDELHVTIRVDKTYAPPRDGRQLGVQLVGDARLAARPGGISLPAPDAALSVLLLVLLAWFAAGRRAAVRWRLLAAGAMACAAIVGALLARVPFWRIAMPLELALSLLVIALWVQEWWVALTWPLRAVQHRTRLDDRAVIVGGAILALVGQTIVAQHPWGFLGAVVLVIGLVAMLAGMVPHPPAPSPSRWRGGAVGAHSRAPSPPALSPHAAQRAPAVLSPTLKIAALIGIAALAVALRLTLLTEMPASLFKDEGRHALKAIRILDDSTYRPVYEPEIALPALFLYPMALAFKLFGVSLLTLRLFMAMMGVVDVLLFFLLSRRLFGTRVALIAAYLFAVSFWALRMQRVALAPCFSTGLVLLGLFLFVRAMQMRRWRDWALAGVGAAGTVYCYHSGPFTLVLIALVALALLVRSPRRFFHYWLARFAVLAVVFLLLAAPLIGYVARHFDQYAARPRQTAILSEVNLRRLGQDRFAALEANIAPNLGMYTVRGDREGKHNLPQAPHLDAIVAVLFLAGVALALAGRLHDPPSSMRRFGEWLALGYLAVMLIPSLLAIDAPNTLRAFDTLPPALLIAALAMDAVWGRAARTPDPSPASGGGELDCLTVRTPLSRMAGEGSGVGVVLLAILALNAGTYFGLMRHDGKETLRFDTYFASQAGKRMVAEADVRPGTTFLVPRATIDRDVFPFFARVMGGTGSLVSLDGIAPASLPIRYVILLPNGTGDPPPDGVIAALPWAKGLERVPGTSPAGAGGVPAFIEYRTLG